MRACGLDRCPCNSSICLDVPIYFSQQVPKVAAAAASVFALAAASPAVQAAQEMAMTAEVCLPSDASTKSMYTALVVLIRIAVDESYTVACQPSATCMCSYHRVSPCSCRWAGQLLPWSSPFPCPWWSGAAAVSKLQRAHWASYALSLHCEKSGNHEAVTM